MKLRLKFIDGSGYGPVGHAELSDDCQPFTGNPDYPSPVLVLFESVLGGEDNYKEKPDADGWFHIKCPLTIEQAKEFQLVLASDEERRELCEAGYKLI
jgi:hypothetical protein